MPSQCIPSQFMLSQCIEVYANPPKRLAYSGPAAHLHSRMLSEIGWKNKSKSLKIRGKIYSGPLLVCLFDKARGASEWPTCMKLEFEPGL